jgi:hypothetical protein
MKVRVLRPALNDLAAGRRFYDRQQEGVGDYFFDSVFADIDSLSTLRRNSSNRIRFSS